MKIPERVLLRYRENLYDNMMRMVISLRNILVVQTRQEQLVLIKLTLVHVAMVK